MKKQKNYMYIRIIFIISIFVVSQSFLASIFWSPILNHFIWSPILNKNKLIMNILFIISVFLHIFTFIFAIFGMFYILTFERLWDKGVYKKPSKAIGIVGICFSLLSPFSIFAYSMIIVRSIKFEGDIKNLQ